MGYDANGNWKPEDDSVTTQMTGLLGKNNNYMKQARTQGLQTANARGFLNSSIAVGSAQDAAGRAALPIAQQNAAQIAQKNVAAQDQGPKERIAAMNVGAHDRQYMAAAAAEASKTYGAVLNEIIKSNDLSAASRDNYQSDNRVRFDDQMSLIEQMYNIDLDWSIPAA